MSDERDPRLVGNRCLKCDALLDGATLAKGDGPRPGSGDWSVCFYCGDVARFNADGTLRALTFSERIELTERQDLQKVRSLVLRRNLG